MILLSSVVSTSFFIVQQLLTQARKWLCNQNPGTLNLLFVNLIFDMGCCSISFSPHDGFSQVGRNSRNSFACVVYQWGLGSHSVVPEEEGCLHKVVQVHHNMEYLNKAVKAWRSSSR